MFKNFVLESLGVSTTPQQSHLAPNQLKELRCSNICLCQETLPSCPRFIILTGFNFDNYSDITSSIDSIKYFWTMVFFNWNEKEFQQYILMSQINWCSKSATTIMGSYPL